MTKNLPKSEERRQQTSDNIPYSRPISRKASIKSMKYCAHLWYISSNAVSARSSMAHLSNACSSSDAPAKGEGVYEGENCTTIFAPERKLCSASDKGKCSATDRGNFFASWAINSFRTSPCTTYQESRFLSYPLKVSTPLIMLIFFAAALVLFGSCTFDPAGLSEENGNTNFGCGNGIIEETEECDDGNLKNGDGCGDQCIVESGWGCAAGDPSVCKPICGDGMIYGDEECDDGNTNTGDGCNENCRAENGFICEGQPSVCYSADCGDGVIQSNEECDDGNADSGDGCSATCEIEHGWECTGQPSYCAPLCGDGIITAEEECDDGNTQSEDGCSNVCNIEPGYECSGEPSVCVNVNCGDGWLQPEEECDDVNNNPGDGCSTDCKIESGWECSEEPSVCHTVCGDGIIAGTEECDDDNNDLDDGCSADCKVEPYFRCSGQPSECTCAVLVNILSTATEPDGLLWSTAYTTVQEGINQAAGLFSFYNIDHCEVWVAQGNYNIYKTSSANTLTLASNIEVYGGFQGTEAYRHQRNWETNITILDGQSESLETNRVQTVVKAPNVTNSVIDGFSIIQSQNTGSGGGLQANNSLFKMVNISFTANSAQNGGGAHLHYSTVDIINCAFQGNIATSSGGGINSSFSDITVIDSTFANNHAITSSGGGIHIYQGSGDFTNCIFKENTASTVGGGINGSNISSVIISDCDFIDNHSTNNNGGGISLYQTPAEFYRCGFHDNTAASNGGGVCSTYGDLDIVESTFSSNTSDTNGGGLYTYQSTTAIKKSTFGSNNIAAFGGAVYSGASTLYVSRSFFNQNNALSTGGAILITTNAHVENSVFTENQAEHGGAVAVTAHNTCTIINSLIYSNISQLVGGGLHVSSWGTINLTNNIIRLNEPDQFFAEVYATSTVRHCNIQGGYNEGGDSTGNIDTDPLLVDPANGDYDLQSGSSCIDAADGDGAPEFDIEGNPRVDDPATTPNTGIGTPDHVDIGPYEYQP